MVSAVTFSTFFMLPKDRFKHQTKQEYWDKLVQSLEQKRIHADEGRFVDWIRTKEKVKDFYFGIYRQLQQFEMPIYLGVTGRSVIAEQAYSYLVSQEQEAR